MKSRGWPQTTQSTHTADERSPAGIYVTSARSGGRAFSIYVTDFTDAKKKKNHRDGKSAGGTGALSFTVCLLFWKQIQEFQNVLQRGWNEPQELSPCFCSYTKRAERERGKQPSINNELFKTSPLHPLVHKISAEFKGRVTGEKQHLDSCRFTKVTVTDGGGGADRGHHWACLTSKRKREAKIKIYIQVFRLSSYSLYPLLNKMTPQNKAHYKNLFKEGVLCFFSLHPVSLVPPWKHCDIYS